MVAINPRTGMFSIALTMSRGAPATHFEVDPQQLDAIKADLDEALGELQMAARDADQLRLIRPPGEDEVSVNGTNRIIDHLTQGPGSAVTTVEEMRRWVSDFRDKIDTAKRQYLRDDDDNEIRTV